MFVDSDVSHFQCLSFYGYTVLVFVVLTLVVPKSTFAVLMFVGVRTSARLSSLL